MKLEVSVPEVLELFKEIQQQPEKLFDMIRCDIKETVGQYLTTLMNAELSHFLGRQPYERGCREVNHRFFQIPETVTVGITWTKSRKVLRIR